jgi:hypothetical protein
MRTYKVKIRKEVYCAGKGKRGAGYALPALSTIFPAR